MLSLGCMPSQGLSRSGSGSWVLHKGADLVGPAFYARPRSEHSRPELEAVAYPLPHPSRSVFWVYNEHDFSGMLCVYSGELVSGNKHDFSGVLCVYSGELVSGFNLPDGCRPSRIPRSPG